MSNFFSDPHLYDGVEKQMNAASRFLVGSMAVIGLAIAPGLISSIHSEIQHAKAEATLNGLPTGLKLAKINDGSAYIRCTSDACATLLPMTPDSTKRGLESNLLKLESAN